MKKYDFLPSRHPPFLQDFCKNAQWRAKKLRERGSNTARPTEKGSPSFKKRKQTFCKNAQWRAKKLRERGSNTARPTEKGGGGLPIGARPVDSVASIRSIRSIRSRRFGVLLVSRFGRFGRFGRVVIWRTGRVVSCRVASCRVVPTPMPTPKPTPKPTPMPTPKPTPWRHPSRHPCRHPCRHQRQGANTKKARSLNRGIGLSYRKASRALNLLLVPLSNTRASARIVRLGLARRSCIVMITSGRRRIVRYT